MTTQVNILSAREAPFIALSANYKWDENISLSANFFQYKEGYSFFEHPIFDKAGDAVYQKNSFLSLTPTSDLYNIINAQYFVDPTEFVIFTTLKNDKNKFVKNINNVLFANTTSPDQECLFRITYNRSKGGWTISQNNLYASVEVSPKKTFIIKLEEKLVNDVNNRQLFKIESSKTANKLIISSLLNTPDWVTGVGWQGSVKRFWSYSEFPGLLGIIPPDNNKIKLMGMIPDDDYSNINNIIWSIGLGDLNLLPIGFDGKMYWIKYYNDIYYKVFNKTVDIKEKYKAMGNLLLDWSYNNDTNIVKYDNAAKIGKFDINMAQLKNVHTPEHSYSNPLTNK